MVAELNTTLDRAVTEPSRRTYRDMWPAPARATVDKPSVLKHLAAQLNQLEKEVDTVFMAKWDEQQLVLKKTRLSALRCKLMQPPSGDCIERLNRARLEAESSLLALEIERNECALRSST